MARSRNFRKGKGKKVYSIIVDGQTEIWYFQMMKKHESLPRIDIRPELPKKKKLKEQYEMVLENVKIYDQVIWMLDLDTLIKENAEKSKGRSSKIQEFKNYWEHLGKYENVEILVNTPCLEFWYLLHFEGTGKYFPKCESAEKALRKNYLKDYQKSQQYYKKPNNDIYKKLKPIQEFAMKNARKVGRFSFENIKTAKAEIFRVLEILEIYSSKN